MLGRLRKTTSVDVGLALTFSGVAYLVWSLVAWTSRDMVAHVIEASGNPSAMVAQMLQMTKQINLFFLDMGFLIDLVGLAWLVLTLVLIVYSGRQRLSISWAWMSALAQCCVAALGGVLVGWAMNLPFRRMPTSAPEAISDLGKLSQISLPVILTVAILVWVSSLVWLMVERARFRNRGPSLRDGLRSNIYK